MALHFHFVQQHYGSSFDVRYIPTTENVADIYTKALPRPAFQRHTEKLGLTDQCQNTVLDYPVFTSIKPSDTTLHEIKPSDTALYRARPIN